MTVSSATNRLVWVCAGGVCSFPDCRADLAPRGAESKGLAIGEVAHIVATAPGGPRGTKPPPGGKVDGFENLLLLCPTHHAEVDRDEARFTDRKSVV